VRYVNGNARIGDFSEFLNSEPARRLRFERVVYFALNPSKSATHVSPSIRFASSINSAATLLGKPSMNTSSQTARSASSRFGDIFAVLRQQQLGVELRARAEGLDQKIFARTR
jgi:hypothetical protein